MKKQNNIEKNLVGGLTKKGKKVLAKKILINVFTKVALKTKKPFPVIIKAIIEKLGLLLEVKTVKMRRNSHIVPSPAGANRRNYLIVKKLLSAVGLDQTNRSIVDKLSDEIFAILRARSSKSLSQRNAVVKQAIINRSNTHYRW